MATVTGYTAARTKEIEDSSIIGGLVNALGRLILRTRAGADIDAGSVVGPRGPSGLGPTGSITMFAGDSAPEGHLLCDGTAVSRTAYSTLFSVIGTKYGAGDGTTTFNLPNFKGRVPVGRDPAQTEFDVLGEVGGAKTHTLTPNEMPTHSHSLPTWLWADQVSGVSGGPTWTNQAASGNRWMSTYADRSQTNPQTGSSGGLNVPHNNLQPYIVMNYIIKT